MRIRFIRGTALGGIGNDAAVGDELDLPEAQAGQFVALGRAVPVTQGEAPAVPAAREPATPKTRKSK